MMQKCEIQYFTTYYNTNFVHFANKQSLFFSRVGLGNFTPNLPD